MKRAISIISAISLVFIMTACGTNDRNENPEIGRNEVAGVRIDSDTRGTQQPAQQNEGENSPSNENNSGSEISLDRAIEIGHEELENRGYSGTFSESCKGTSRGQRVWELIYRVDGGNKPLAEVYVNRETGEVVKFEWDD